MPDIYNAHPSHLMGVIGAWRDDARAIASEISECRAGKRQPEYRDLLTMFGLATAEITAWLIANRPAIDIGPILRFYETAQKWGADHDTARLPDEKTIETQLDVADVLVFSLDVAIAWQNSSSEDAARQKKETKGRAVRDKARDARDRWIYAECCKGIAYDTIAIKLGKKPPDWPRIESKQGIQTAAKKYAERNGLPPIPRRQE